MKKVVILAAQHCVLSTVAAPMDMFLQAGVLWNDMMGQPRTPLFEVKIVTFDGQPVMAQNEVPVVPSCAMTAVEDPDLIIIPSQGFSFDPQSREFNDRVNWLKGWYDKGADLASICAGAFTLASTGLLDGKEATTHWGMAKQFKRAFPAVKLRTDLMVTDQGRLFCGGGVTADLNLALYLIDKYCGREVALQSSRCTLVDLDRLSQLPFTVFVPDKNHNDTEILDIQQWMEGNYQNAISMETLAKELGTSLRHFNRRFKSATGETGVKYLQLIRVEAAKKQLINTNLSFDEIAVDVGYENVSFFRRIFKDKTGLTPVNFRRKFMQM
jgi:transcriptional regulator GlxA family with amidase domain